MKRLATAGYFLCWTLAAAIVVLIASFFLSTVSVGFVQEYSDWIDDDALYLLFPLGALLGALLGFVLLLLVPLGALLGFVAAWKTRESPKLHRACRVLGLILALVGITMAIVFAEKAGAFPNTVMFSGFLYAVFTVLFGILAVIGILVMGIAGFGMAMLPQSPTGE